MYISTPTYNIIPIITTIMNNNYTDENTAHEIINLTNIIPELNYFQYDKKRYKHARVSNGRTHISYTIRNISTIHRTHICGILQKHNTNSYHKYVNDLLYDTTKTNITSTLHDSNNINKKLQFTMEHEENNKINYLDTIINRGESNLT
jgi:hypothetical protein